MRSMGDYLLGILLVVALAVWAPFSGAARGTHNIWSADQGSAAYRDGLFHGRLNAARGGKLHLSSARWSRDSDRRAYVSGYMRGYVGSGGSVVVVQGAEKGGYHDGMENGALHRDSGQGFHLTRKLRPAPAEAASEFAYREAYASGYQLAYYGNQDAADALVIWPLLSPSN
jgi:hypothetical protein